MSSSLLCPICTTSNPAASGGCSRCGAEFTDGGPAATADRAAVNRRAEAAAAEVAAAAARGLAPRRARIETAPDPPAGQEDGDADLRGSSRGIVTEGGAPPPAGAAPSSPTDAEPGAAQSVARPEAEAPATVPPGARSEASAHERTATQEHAAAAAHGDQPRVSVPDAAGTLKQRAVTSAPPMQPTAAPASRPITGHDARQPTPVRSERRQAPADDPQTARRRSAAIAALLRLLEGELPGEEPQSTPLTYHIIERDQEQPFGYRPVPVVPQRERLKIAELRQLIGMVAAVAALIIASAVVIHLDHI